jgi:hypothetical protein
MSARQQRVSVRASCVIVLTLCSLLLACPSAFATVTHRVESSFNGFDAPEGPFGLIVADAVDDSTGPSAGDVYAAEFAAIDKFEPNGTYARVRITGEDTPQGSFTLVSENAVTGRIAVDSSKSSNSGDVYVSDMEHGVIDRFKENGEFDCQITGKTPGSPAEVEHECAGAKGSSTPGGSIEPAGIAINPANGDVWVSDRAHAAIDEFNPAGEYVGQIQDAHIVSPGPIAITSSGDLYVTNGSTIFSDAHAAGNNVVVFHEGAFVKILDKDRPLSVAVDPGTGHVYVYELEGGTIAEYDASGGLEDRFFEKLLGSEPSMESLAVSSDGHIYAAETGGFSPAFVAKYSPDLTVPTVATESATAITETSATLHGHIDPDAVHGGDTVISCEFEYINEEAFEAHGFEEPTLAACTPAAPLSGPEGVSATVALSHSTSYRFRLRAVNANGVDSFGDVEQFSTVGSPVIVNERSSTLTTNGASLSATILPSGFEADCHLEYVSRSAFEAAGFNDATRIPCTPGTILASTREQHVSATVTGLALNTIYHYRFVSDNSAGRTPGQDETFATFGISSFAFEVLDKEGHDYTQAGGHPYAWTTTFKINSTPSEVDKRPIEAADANLRDVETELPPGFIASATATARCPRYLVALDQCTPGSQVGEVEVTDAIGERMIEGLYNVEPPRGVPFELGAVVQNLVRVYIDGNVRTGGDYGATAKVLSVSEQDNIRSSRVTIWGVPEDPNHDARRVCPVRGEQIPVGFGCPAAGPPVPLLTNPTSCPGIPLTATLRADSWQEPGRFVIAKSEIPATTGCGVLDFTPSVSIAPDTSVADTPAGLSANIEVPQNETPSGLASSALKNTTVELPAGVSVSPAAANGLEACSEAQIGLHDEAAPRCPNGSKIGTVEITSPLIADHLRGGVYVARQGENPFGSLLAMYIAAEADGARVKLAGHIVADPVTGQLTTTFTETPQIPFSDFKLNLFGGHRGVLATPEACGSPNTNVSLAPWDGLAPTKFGLPFTTSTGCVSGFSPAFEAGTVSAQAGAYAPFTLSFSRSDSQEDFAGATVTLPSGLIGKIAGVGQCSDAQLAAAAAHSGAAEQASPSCPASSLIGTVQTTAGPGPSPVSVSGKAYLTGPYKGGPYGIAVVVPAVAGPFDLGTVVVRQSLRIDRGDAHVTDISDPFPTILQGVPLRLKSVSVTLDRPGFTFNPTSCAAKTITATLTSTGGASAGVSSPFQAANCATLPLKPSFSVTTQANTSKANGASLLFKIGSGTGQANLGKVRLTFPKQLPARLTTLQKACTEAQFNTNPAGCPEGSVIGTATAHTPVLAGALTGPIYLVSHGGAAFPDAVVILQGEGITLYVVGNTNIKKGITTSTFNAVPDAPISTFEALLPEGPHSAFATNIPVKAKGNMCGQALTMPNTFTGQNGAQIVRTTRIGVTGCPKAKKTKKKTKGKKTHGHAKGKKK